MNKSVFIPPYKAVIVWPMVRTVSIPLPTFQDMVAFNHWYSSYSRHFHSNYHFFINSQGKTVSPLEILLENIKRTKQGMVDKVGL